MLQNPSRMDKMPRHEDIVHSVNGNSHHCSRKRDV